MVKIFWLLIGLTVVLLPQPLFAKGEMTVGDLREICTSSDDASKAACKFYILGVANGASLSAALSKDNQHVCIAPDMTAAEMEFVVKKAVGEDLMFYPKDADLAVVGFVLGALVKAHPCAK